MAEFAEIVSGDSQMTTLSMSSRTVSLTTFSGDSRNLHYFMEGAEDRWDSEEEKEVSLVNLASNRDIDSH